MFKNFLITMCIIVSNVAATQEPWGRKPQSGALGAATGEQGPTYCKCWGLSYAVAQKCNPEPAAPLFEFERRLTCIRTVGPPQARVGGMIACNAARSKSSVGDPPEPQ